MEFSNNLKLCCLAVMLLFDVVYGYPKMVTKRDVAEAESFKLVVKEGLAINKAVSKRIKRQYNNSYIELIRICYNQRKQGTWSASCDRVFNRHPHSGDGHKTIDMG